MHSPLKITAMGGGTGTHTVLSGLKRFPGVDPAAVVSIADNGGSSGKILLDNWGRMLPTGDIRQCLVALAEVPEEVRARFEKREDGHPYGNLILRDLIRKYGALEGVRRAHGVFRVRGEVIPASGEHATLCAILEDGTEIVGEDAIEKAVLDRALIRECYLKPSVDPNPAALEAILTSDVIILGPGDLYTSLVPVLLVPGIADALATTEAKLVFVVNLVTKRGQTVGYGASRFVRTVERHIDDRLVDYVIVNNGLIPPEALAKYERDGEAPVVDDLSRIDPRVVRGDYVNRTPVTPTPGDDVERSLIRHDEHGLVAAIMNRIRMEDA